MTRRLSPPATPLALLCAWLLLAAGPPPAASDDLDTFEPRFTAREAWHVIPYGDAHGLPDLLRRDPAPLYRCGPSCTALHARWHDAVRHREADRCVHGDAGLCAPCPITSASFPSYVRRVAEGAREGDLERVDPGRRARRLERANSARGRAGGCASFALAAGPAPAVAQGGSPGLALPGSPLSGPVAPFGLPGLSLPPAEGAHLRRAPLPGRAPEPEARRAFFPLRRRVL